MQSSGSSLLSRVAWSRHFGSQVFLPLLCRAKTGHAYNVGSELPVNLLELPTATRDTFAQWPANSSVGRLEQQPIVVSTSITEGAALGFSIEKPFANVLFDVACAARHLTSLHRHC